MLSDSSTNLGVGAKVFLARPVKRSLRHQRGADWPNCPPVQAGGFSMARVAGPDPSQRCPAQVLSV